MSRPVVTNVVWLLLLLIGCASGTEKGLEERPWLSLTDEWTPEVANQGVEATAPAIIARFKNDHSFTMIYCVLNRLRRTGEVAVNGGEGMVLFVGQWRRDTSGRLSLSLIKVEDPYETPQELRDQRVKMVSVEEEDDTLTISGERGQFKMTSWMSAEKYDALVDPIVEAHRKAGEMGGN